MKLFERNLKFISIAIVSIFSIVWNKQHSSSILLVCKKR